MTEDMATPNTRQPAISRIQQAGGMLQRLIHDHVPSYHRVPADELRSDVTTTMTMVSEVAHGGSTSPIEQRIAALVARRVHQGIQPVAIYAAAWEGRRWYEVTFADDPTDAALDTFEQLVIDELRRVHPSTGMREPAAGEMRSLRRHAERIAVALELAEPSVGVALPHPHSALTRREREVLSLVAGGLTVDAVALQLSLSPATVSTYIRRATDKLGANGRTHAVALAIRLGVIEPWQPSVDAGQAQRTAA